MRKFAMIALVILFATIILPLAIVFVMDKAIDNDPQGSHEILENAGNDSENTDEPKQTDAAETQ